LGCQYSIRHARSAIARLDTDYKEVTSRLAHALEAAFAPGPSSGSSSETHITRTNGIGGIAQDSSLANGHGDNEESNQTPGDWPGRPVVRVNSVAAGSPALQAVCHRWAILG
jgi:hypothetical protein